MKVERLILGWFTVPAGPSPLGRGRPARDGSWATVENAGHTVQGDNPRGLAEVLTRFLAEIGHS
jgi:hypothetical protein